MRLRRLVPAALAVVGFCPPTGSAAQSVVSGTVSGTVRQADGAGLPGAAVVLSPIAGGASRATTTTAGGGYRFAFVPAGSYEVRFELFGFRPALVGPFPLSAGEARTVDVDLALEPPPASRVDTLEAQAGSTGRRVAGAVRLDARDLASVPDLASDVGDLAVLASTMDASLGGEGLPGRHAGFYADGIPFRAASHPRLRTPAHAPPLFPRSALADVWVHHNPNDIEWSGAAGTYVTTTTRTSPASGSGGLSAAWSGDPVWSSGRLPFEAPALASGWVSGEAAVELVPGQSRLFVLADAVRLETPGAPVVSSDTISAVSGLDPDLVAQLATPQVGRWTRTSGIARLDWAVSPESTLMLRASAAQSTSERESPSPTSARRGAVPPEEGTDLALGGSLTTEYESGLRFELRGGVSASDRTFAGAGMATPSTWLSGPGLQVGGRPVPTADVRRVDAYLTPVGHFEVGGGSIKAGGWLRASRHVLRYSFARGGAYLFPDAGALVAGRGAYVASTAPESRFATGEVGGFAQYGWEAAPGLDLSIGLRFDAESIPSSEVRLSSAWEDATGLRNTDHPSEFKQVGARSSMVWRPGGDPRTRIFAVLALHHGDMDPGMMHELFTSDGAGRVSRAEGTGLPWPSAPAASALTTSTPLALLGADAQAPQSTRANVGFVRELAGAWRLHVNGVFRRTDFLMRRRNLNRHVQALAQDAFGRDVFGDLVQDGSLITTTIGSNRRFPELGDVWALDSDGWSEYRGVTLGLEHDGSRVATFASFTRSETRDNWIGAASDHPDAELTPALPDLEVPWEEGVSDFDVPSRAAAGLAVRFGSVAEPRVTVSAVYRYASGAPFTPGYRGVDANGDGALRNDVAFVPDVSELGELADAWRCLESQSGTFAARNSCRGADSHGLDASVSLRLGHVGGWPVRISVEGFDLVEPSGGLTDDALLLGDEGTPIAVSPNGDTVTVPVVVNPDFGKVVAPRSRGRIIRVGIGIGG